VKACGEEEERAEGMCSAFGMGEDKERKGNTEKK
jgi:hypothetical protein